MRHFLITTKEELRKEILEQKLHMHLNSLSFSIIKKATKIFYDNIQDDGILEVASENFDFYYNHMSSSFGFKEIFKNNDLKSFCYFYPGVLYNDQTWLFEIEISDDDFNLFVSKNHFI